MEAGQVAATRSTAPTGWRQFILFQRPDQLSQVERIAGARPVAGATQPRVGPTGSSRCTICPTACSLSGPRVRTSASGSSRIASAGPAARLARLVAAPPRARCVALPSAAAGARETAAMAHPPSARRRQTAPPGRERRDWPSASRARPESRTRHQRAAARPPRLRVLRAPWPPGRQTVRPAPADGSAASSGPSSCRRTP